MILGIGVDLVEIDRIKKILEKTGERFCERILTENERSYCKSFSNPAPCIAARFAAKEAFLKAIGTGLSVDMSWHDIEVSKEENGRPGLNISGGVLKTAKKIGADQFHLSITHSEKSAMAFVIIESCE
jgi:holo-[acyl-carrier protein] synthase